MRIRQARAAVALAASAALALGACGGDGDGGDGDGKAGQEGEFNAAFGQVFNASDTKGGIIKLGQSGDWADSVDPGDTYYGYSWNFVRTYTRALTMFKVAAGDASQELVGDLAEDLGEASNGGRTWTYRLRQGVKFEDGTEVTSKDVAYAVQRAFDKQVHVHGPTYLHDLLNWPADYKGAYKSPDMDVSSAIETPDDYTIVFHLKQPFAGFDYLAMLPETAPVPKAADTGVRYKQHVVSSGPYMWDTFQSGKRYVLKRNPEWDPATDPNREALADGYEVTLNMNPDDVDQQVLAGTLDADVQGTGAQPAAITRILQDPNLKKGVDNPTTNRLWFTYIVGTVKPLDNIECRKAVMYAMDRTSYQNAYGGPIAGGEIATTVLPPVIPGYEEYDLFPSTDNKGDLDKAKEALQKCGHPGGFETNIAYRAERPKEKATAEAFQQALARVGIKLSIRPEPEGTYTSDTCGLPPYVRKNNLGLCVYGWGADWNDGFGFLSQIIDSRTIRETGGAANMAVRDPVVDRMLDDAKAELDRTTREQKWAEIDKKVMADAFIFPGLYAKSILIRPKDATNVFVNEQFGMYDYLAMGAGG